MSDSPSTCSRSQRKKDSRKRKRQEEARARDAADQQESVVEETGTTVEDEGNATSLSTKVYSVALPPSGWNSQQKSISNDPADEVDFESLEQPATKRMHRGLRCKKCFHLLCRDQDFRYHNNELWVASSVLRDKQWDGLVLQHGKVFCQKMHKVGSIQRTTHANSSVHVPVLNIDKTTFRENFTGDSNI